MLLQNEIRNYLETSGQSRRGLSMRAGLNPKAVGDILNRPGHRPTRGTIEALNEVVGFKLPDPEPQITYAQLIARVSRKTGDHSIDRRNTRFVSRLKKVIEAAEWVPEIEVVDRSRIIEMFDRWSPATLGLSKGSFHNYKSDALAAIEEACGSNRKPGIIDARVMYRNIHSAIQDSDLPKDMKLISGSFLLFLDRAGLFPHEITQSILLDYYRQRCEETTKIEAVCRKHVKRVAALCCRLATEPAFVGYRFPEVNHPFEDARDKYGVPVSALDGFLTQFDGPVTRWALGEESRDGLSYEDFLKTLDDVQSQRPATGKLALLKPRQNGRKKTEEERRSAGFLVADETWSKNTIQNRRGILIGGAKALYAATG
jgi:hypothetical protein